MYYYSKSWCKHLWPGFKQKQINEHTNINTDEKPKQKLTNTYIIELIQYDTETKTNRKWKLLFKEDRLAESYTTEYSFHLRNELYKNKMVQPYQLICVKYYHISQFQIYIFIGAAISNFFFLRFWKSDAICLQISANVCIVPSNASFLYQIKVSLLYCLPTTSYTI